MKLRNIQAHHIKYYKDCGYDWVVPIYRGEHWAITQLQRRKYISKGFIYAIKDWISENEINAVDLTQAYETQKQLRGKK